jgi:hypothetical protein
MENSADLFYACFTMTTRTGKIIGWICAILVGAFNAFAAVMKYVPQEAGSPGDVMVEQLGVRDLNQYLGVIEIIIIVLFLIPRTSTVGFVLMIGYMGGAFATNLTHGFDSMPEMIPFIVIFIVLTISAYFRNPELLSRLLKKPVPEKV